MEFISTNFEENSMGNYVGQPYQVMIAAEMYSKADTRVACQLLAGQGKTFIVLMLAKAHLLANETV
jgi:hypothetical protein